MSKALITQTVQLIFEGFTSYIKEFNHLTRQAPGYFIKRDWSGMQALSRKRLRLYKDHVNTTTAHTKSLLDYQIADQILWHDIKIAYSQKIKARRDKELAESYFNSTIRKSTKAFSIDDHLMFVHEGFVSCKIFPHDSLFFSYPADWGLQRIIRQIVSDFDFGVPYLAREKDIQHLVRTVREVVLSRYPATAETTTQVLKKVFYRNKAAYLIGRTYLGRKWMPFIIPFLHEEEGIYVDTLIFDPNLMSSIFSYTRSYFLVEADIPAQIVSFLNSVITHKKIYELYNSIGFNKHGKTEFYRDYLDHLNQSKDHFIVAPGIKGMVMTVFTLPSYNIVFKLIKDSFEPPKNMTKREVKEKYNLVSLHDRVGRMADTHEFENFQFPLDRIHPALLQELKDTCNSLLDIRDNTLTIRHLYTERRLTPLNLYLDSCSHEEAKIAVEEYGSAILQLAKANIFPGDMMTKNFGVTRQQRVIFYDYDEIEFLTDMNIREKPKAETFEQIYASEPWYEIGPKDIFPEDFRPFMIGRKDVKEYFWDYHKRLFDPVHWKSIQEKVRAGEVLHAFPYPKYMRFRPEREG
jgi:isocitrate dehydrogenase kinase/phosphatase